MYLDCTVLVDEQKDFTLQAVSSPVFNKKKHDAAFEKIMREASRVVGYDRYTIYVDIDESEAGIDCVCTAPSLDFAEMYKYDVLVATMSDDPCVGDKAYCKTMSRDKMLEVVSRVCNEDKLPEDLDTWEDFTESFYGGRKEEETEEEKRASRIGGNYRLAYSDEEYFPEYWSVVRDKYMNTYSIYTSEHIMDKLWAACQYEKILQIFREYRSDPVYAYYAAEVLFNGFTGSPDYAKAFEYYRFAVYRGEVCAYCKLAIMYRDGLGVEKNYDEYKRLLLEGYNAVLECGKEYLPVIEDILLELSRAGQACGNTKDALKAVSLITDKLEHIWAKGAAVTKTDVECVEQLYSLKSFARSKRQIMDFLYILQKPCKVRFTIFGKEHTAEAAESGGEVIVSYEGQYYRDPVQFMNKATIDGKPIRTYAKELQKMEVIA